MVFPDTARLERVTTQTRSDRRVSNLEGQLTSIKQKLFQWEIWQFWACDVISFLSSSQIAGKYFLSISFLSQSQFRNSMRFQTVHISTCGVLNKIFLPNSQQGSYPFASVAKNKCVQFNCLQWRLSVSAFSQAFNHFLSVYISLSLRWLTLYLWT